MSKKLLYQSAYFLLLLVLVAAIPARVRSEEVASTTERTEAGEQGDLNKDTKDDANKQGKDQDNEERIALWVIHDPFEQWGLGSSRIFDTHFGLGLDSDDLFFSRPKIPTAFHQLLRYPGGYLRPWRPLDSNRDAGSRVEYGKDKFEANLDVQQFKPEEISVKVTGDNVVTVEGKHKEQKDEQGYIARQFTRRYVLPKGHDVGKIESKLSSDGVLTIIVPKTGAPEIEDRTIPIVQTGEPARKVIEDEKKNDNDQKQGQNEQDSNRT